MDLDEVRAAFERMPYRPMEVRIDLVTPVVLGPDPLCLDSLLTERLALQLFGPSARDRNRSLVELPLPLKRTGSVWHASIAFPDGGTRGRDFLVKRWSFDIPGVDRSIGWSKEYRMAVRYLATPGLIFYANGSVEAVRTLLSGLRAVGRFRAKGFGEVWRVRVRPVKHDWSLWRDGQPQRPIPIDEVRDPARYYVAPTGYRPPTWRAENQGVCVLPNPETWLRVYPPPPELDDEEKEWLEGEV